MKLQLIISLFTVSLILIFATCSESGDNIIDRTPPYVVPKDLPRGNDSDLAEASKFAWDVFVALNWPVQPGSVGVPNTNAKFGDPGTTVWETYKEGFDIFRANAEPPTPWGMPTPLPNACDAPEGFVKNLRESSKVGQFHDFVNEVQQAVGGVLVDQDTNAVHYEVLMNQTMFEYVDENKFYNALNQMKAKVIEFPIGSIEFKASWKILTEGKDDFSRYHTASAYIFTPESQNDITSEGVDCLPVDVFDRIVPCSLYTVGLMGLHIVYKTPSSPTFVWMTYEQEDNVEGPNPSLNNPDDSAAPRNMRQCYCPEQYTSQITREYCIPDVVERANEAFHSGLPEGNKWRHYKLVGVQWPQDLTAGRDGDPGMDFLGNTSMETYNQTASSCVGCHSFARSSNPAKLSDFSWVMGRAQMPQQLGFPDPDGPSVLAYVNRVDPYPKWGTFPNTVWNTYSNLYLPGENPHGRTTRIFLNQTAEDYINNLPTGQDINYPNGSIVLKENYRSPPSKDPLNHPPPQSALIELTLFYKSKGFNPAANDWFAMKTDANGLDIDRAGKVDGCYSCHGGWDRNADFMLTYNHDQPPVIVSNLTRSAQLCGVLGAPDCKEPRNFN